MECFVSTEVDLHFFQLFKPFDSLHVFFGFTRLDILDDTASEIDSVYSFVFDGEHAELKLVNLGHHLLPLALNVFVSHLASVLENAISDGAQLLIELRLGWFELPGLHQNSFFYVVNVICTDFIAQN